MSIAVIYIVRKVEYEVPVAFMRAYERHPAGVKHRLIVACKGWGERETLEVDGADNRQTWLYVPDTGFDIGTYRRVAEQIDAEYICCLNSWSRPLVDGWLKRLYDAVTWMPDETEAECVGAVGCTGSLEGIPSAPFPNMHLRTNAFCINRELFLEIAPVEPTREECLLFEAGPNSMTKQLTARGLKVVEVGRDRNSLIGGERRVFRWGNQENLLVADNRTDDYQNADKAKREWLQRLAWGTTE